MAHPTPNERQLDRIIGLFLFALFLLVSPAVERWAADDSAWYTPYLLWLGLIAAMYWLQRRAAPDPHDL